MYVRPSLEDETETGTSIVSSLLRKEFLLLFLVPLTDSGTHTPPYLKGGQESSRFTIVHSLLCSDLT